MTKTESYQLSQWDADDPVRREDFNSDNAKLDAALGEQAQALAAETAAREACGNCGIYVQTYCGTGETTGLTLTFPRRPVVVIVFDETGVFVIALRDMPKAHMHNVNYIAARWEGSSVMLSYSDQAFMNTAGRQYIAVALVDMSE